MFHRIFILFDWIIQIIQIIRLAYQADSTFEIIFYYPMYSDSRPANLISWTSTDIPMPSTRSCQTLSGNARKIWSKDQALRSQIRSNAFGEVQIGIWAASMVDHHESITLSINRTSQGHVSHFLLVRLIRHHYVRRTLEVQLLRFPFRNRLVTSDCLLSDCLMNDCLVNDCFLKGYQTTIERMTTEKMTSKRLTTQLPSTKCQARASSTWSVINLVPAD